MVNRSTQPLVTFVFQTLFLLIVFGGTPSPCLDCPTLLRQVVGKVVSFPRTISDWSVRKKALDFSQVKALKITYLKDLRDNTFSKDRLPSSPEEKLAFWEAIREHSGAPNNGNGISTDPSVTLSNSRLLRFLKSINLKKGISFEQARSLSSDFFLVSKLDPMSFEALVKNGWLANVEGLIQHEVEKELSAKPIFEALSNLGLVRDPSTMERFSRFLVKNSIGVEALTTSVYSLPIFMGYPPLHVPGVKRFSAEKFSQELTQKILKEGFDSVHDELFKAYGKPATFDLAWSWMKKSLTHGLMLAFAYFIIEDDKKKRGLEGKEELDKIVEELPDKIGSVTDNRELLFEQWKQASKEQTGVEPDPASEDYKQIRKLLNFSN
jgi:hypothetical protein